MAIKIQGNDVFIKLGAVTSSYSGALIMYCNQGLTFNFANEFNEVTPMDSASIAFIPTYKSCSIEASMILVHLADAGYLDFDDLTQWWEDQEEILFNISYDISPTQVKVIQGRCYIGSLSTAANYNEIGLVNVSLQVTGEIEIFII